MESIKKMDPEEERIQAVIAEAKARAEKSMAGAPVVTESVKTCEQLLLNTIPYAVINSSLNVSRMSD
jgi:hypothetical protein